MDPSYKPPDIFGDSDSESDAEYVPSRADEGKRNAEGIILTHIKPSRKLGQMALPEPWETQENISHYRNSYHIHSQIIDVSSSKLDKDVSDGDGGVYRFVDKVNDQVCPLNSFLT